ncbi:hypothetical protein PENNAL_c0944G04229 [Penicillium nalgiovense]|uniref:DUF4219 domain-containing protein n=1 Tax=Penicillium nalgiovense TaxID=60175 RepID=A0A1V6TT50_PENNA|nr:hypothetical protein PENNAL_c0944G04229 [Penicillium nalgiovense]
MSALVHDSPDRAVTAIEPLTGSDNFATWKRLMTSCLKARQIWDVVSGDLQRPDCLFKYSQTHYGGYPPLGGAPLQRGGEAARSKWRSRRSSATVNGRVAKPRPYHTIFRYLSPHISIHVAGLETSRDLWNELEEPANGTRHVLRAVRPASRNHWRALRQCARIR